MRRAARMTVGIPLMAAGGLAGCASDSDVRGDAEVHDDPDADEVTDGAVSQDGGKTADAGGPDADAAPDIGPEFGPILFFGGSDGKEEDRTRVWDGTDWPLVSSGEPPARQSHALVYDRSRERVVLFGGARGTNKLDDTWEWDGLEWEERFPDTSLRDRSGHALAYDEARSQVLMFGGDLESTSGSAGGPTDETWIWDGTDWQELSLEESPPPRVSHALAYDQAREVVVLFGGGNWSDGWLNDTWTWNGQSWSEASPEVSPPARGYHALAYDAARERVVLFGGRDSDGQRNDTWTWDGSGWEQAAPGESPPARSSHALAYDATGRVVVLVGGLDFDPALYRVADTWIWYGHGWQKVSDESPAISGHALAPIETTPETQ